MPFSRPTCRASSGDWTDANNPFKDDWSPAAQVALEGTDAQALAAYKSKFNFDPTNGFDPTQPGDRLNEIHLCNGDRSKCEVPDSVDRMKCVDSEGTWWAQIVAADDPSDILHKCVTRRPMDFPVPGTARWRWLADDEGGWMRCMNACCEVQ